MLFQTVATRVLSHCTPLLRAEPSAHVSTPMLPISVPGSAVTHLSDAPRSTPYPPARLSPLITTPRFYWTRIVPVGLLFCASLVLSNLAYLYLSVPFIQMIKAGSPIAVLSTSFAFGLKNPSLRLISIIFIICGGVGIASWGEADFRLVGFSIQVLAIMAEATRLTMIQLLLHGVGLTPLLSLHMFAPPCLGALLILILPVEGLAPIYDLPRLGLFVLLPNAMLTLVLNVSAIYIINLSSLVLSLSKVFKDIVLVVGSIIVLGHSVTMTQFIGYGIALVGLGAYKVYGD